MADVDDEVQKLFEENVRINDLLDERNRLLDEANGQIEELNKKFDKERLYSAELCKKIIELSDELARFSIREEEEDEPHCNGNSTLMGSCNGTNGTTNGDTNGHLNGHVNGVNGDINGEHLYDEKEEELELENSLKRKNSLTPINELMLSCTLCGERTKLDELELHSKKCSSGSGKKGTNGKEPKSPTLPGMMVATVTTSRRESVIYTDHNASSNFKIICKTTIQEFKKSLLVVERSMDDFIWYKNALERLHPECIIPPLIFREDLTGNLREAQRFLSRICVHNMLKASSLTRKFFEATSREFEKIQRTFNKKMPVRLKTQRPAVEVVDKEGLLFRTQTYMSQLINNLESLMKYFKENKDKKTSGLSQCFLALSYGETNETYLQMMSKALSSIIGDLENKRDGIYDESVLAEDLESVLAFTKAADALLSRVEGSINTYLYWEEQIRVFEELKLEGLVTETNGKSITQLWAEASSNCRTAKTDLENICRNLSSELIKFDTRKEHELKQIFIEYAESRHDVFETMQSKWFGVRMMLNADINPGIRAINLST